LFFNGRPGGGFTGEGEPPTTGGLHCSDTHCTCPGGLVFKPDGDGEPELNFNKPRPRLWPTAAITTSHNDKLQKYVPVLQQH